jgi:hypothetical protein
MIRCSATKWPKTVVEIVQEVLYLSPYAASFVNVQVIPVDLGIS